MLTISSPIVLKNNTNFDFQIKVLTSLNEEINHDLLSTLTYPVPLDILNSKLGIKLLKGDNYSDFIVLNKIVKVSNTHSFEINLDNRFFLITILREKDGIGNVSVIIEPSYILKNSLPIKLEYQIMSQVWDKGLIGTLHPHEDYQESFSSISMKLYIRLRIQGFLFNFYNF